MDILLDLDFNLTGFKDKTDEELAVLAKHDKSAAAVLAARYSDLVFIKSEIFADLPSDKDDLRQEGLMSLLKAMEAFDPGKRSEILYLCGGVYCKFYAEFLRENKKSFCLSRQRCSIPKWQI